MDDTSEMQGSKLAIAHGNQNVTWATWKRRKIAQLDIKNSSSPVSLNSIDLTQMLIKDKIKNNSGIVSIYFCVLVHFNTLTTYYNLSNNN
jgi:hypothetical protein